MLPLDVEERKFLAYGTLQWAGPAHPPDVVVAAFGMPSRDALSEEAVRLVGKLLGDDDLTDEELVFALVSTEVLFACDRWGAGSDWVPAAGFSDQYSILMLRQLQLKLRPLGMRQWPS